MTKPLVSIVVPTLARRAQFLALLREAVDAQTYPADRVAVLVDDAATGTPGKKRNGLVAGADPACDLFLIGDDDDLILPGALDLYVGAALAFPSKKIFGTTRFYSYDLVRRQAVTMRHGRVKCSTILFRRAAWEACPFEESEQTPPRCATCHMVDTLAADVFDLWNLDLRVRFVWGGQLTETGRPLQGQDMSKATSAVESLIGGARLSRYQLAALAAREGV